MRPHMSGVSGSTAQVRRSLIANKCTQVPDKMIVEADAHRHVRTRHNNFNACRRSSDTGRVSVERLLDPVSETTKIELVRE